VKLSIPTPTTSAVAIGPLTVHFYALCIIAGVACALWIGNKRFIRFAPDSLGVVSDVAVVAIPAGVIGGRLYHVLTTPEKYFGKDGNFQEIFRVWHGGLGIWGAIFLGTVAAYISYRRLRLRRELPPFLVFADALAPGILIAQAIGRWGNWFNGELFGRPLTAAWALEIPDSLRPNGFQQYSTFHPTFLYESIWCLLLAISLLTISRRFPPGAIFTLYVAFYSVGRFFIEGLRIDFAHSYGGLRLNQYVALFTSAIAFVALAHLSKRKR
jgi:prolipoprotein diacylglyceryl transferase